MNFLDTTKGTNWETPSPRRASRWLLWVLLSVAALLLAAQLRAARAWVTIHSESYGARLRLSVPDADGVHPFYVHLADQSAIYGGYANGKTYTGDIPSGRYTVAVENLQASGDWLAFASAPVELPSTGELFALDWFGLWSRISYGAGLPGVGEPGGEPPSTGGSGSSAGTATIEWNHSHAVYAFSVGFFTFLAFGVWRSVRRIFNDAD